MAASSIPSAHVFVSSSSCASSLAHQARPRAAAVAPFSSDLLGIRLSQASISAGPKAAAARKPSPAYCKVSVGDVAPEVSLLDQNGKPFSLSKLKGKRNVVLYFYPADDTPGCTKQACSFRDSFEDFSDLGAEVVGISGGSPESHKSFAEKYDLPFRLLADEGDEVRKEWGVPADLFGFLPGRQTYVIDKKGVVQLVFNSQFKPEKHIEETVAVLEGLKDVPDEGGFKLPQLPKLPALPKLPKLF